jgi:hypothetical protein
LHPEFEKTVNKADDGLEEMATINNECYTAIFNAKKIPKFSFAVGVDYGESGRVNLPPLTVTEEYIICQARLLVSILKLSGYQVANGKAAKSDTCINPTIPGLSTSI